MKRRTFLRQSAIASTSLWVPAFIRHYQSERLSSRHKKILVVIQWSGGNDGLNTLVPLGQDTYYQLRPNLALRGEEVISLTPELGMHASLAPLVDGIHQGFIQPVNQVGYPNPDRSHFRSMDIWQSASGSDQTWSTGWLGRYLDHECAGCSPHSAIEVGDALTLALKGKERQGFVLEDPELLQRAASNPYLRALAGRPVTRSEGVVPYLYKVMQETHSSADLLGQAYRAHPPSRDFPATPLGKQLEIIARLILSDEDIHIFYASLTGFDTHANQKPAQSRLLKEYAEALQIFMAELQHHQLWQDTLVLTFSEFGRRVAENASRGTDHGAANQVWLAGGSLTGDPLRRSVPDLSKLIDGDLAFRTDFRSIYQAILGQWLATDANQVLNRDFPEFSLHG